MLPTLYPNFTKPILINLTSFCYLSSVIFLPSFFFFFFLILILFCYDCYDLYLIFYRCLLNVGHMLEFISYLCQDRWQWTLFYFLFSFLFYFSFLFHSHVLFLKQLGLGFISHAVTSVTNWWHSHQTDHGTWENGVEGTRIK